MKASDMKLVRTRVGGVKISTDLAPIERRVGLACKIAKLNMGVPVLEIKIRNNRKKNTDRLEFFCR